MGELSRQAPRVGARYIYDKCQRFKYRSVHTVQRWLRLGWMGGVRTPGGDWRIPRGEVEKMLTTAGD